MRARLLIAVLGSAALLPMSLEAQFRGPAARPAARMAPPRMAAPRVAPPMAAPRFVPPNAVARPMMQPSRVWVRGSGFRQPGFATGFRFRHRHHHRFFFTSGCFNGAFFSPFCAPFFNGFFPFTGFSPPLFWPDYSYAQQPQPVQQVTAAPEDSALRAQIDRLTDEVERLREEQQARATPPPSPARVTPEAPVLTVLVFRDGRRSEVQNYAIVGQTLWIFSESRARKVPLTELDLAATKQANADRGVEFSVPPERNPGVSAPGSLSPQPPRPQPRQTVQRATNHDSLVAQ